jgi:hypothetical protein
MRRLPGWKRRGNGIVKAFVGEDFAHAMGFVNMGGRPTDPSCKDGLAVRRGRLAAVS